MFRFHCLRLFVAMTILVCNVYQQRARMLTQWIRVAEELRGALGNLYGFAYVMQALQCPQVLSTSYVFIVSHVQVATWSCLVKQQHLLILIQPALTD